MLLNILNRDMFKPFRSHSGLLNWIFGRVLEDLHMLREGLLQRNASMRRNKIALVTCLKKLNVSGALLTIVYSSVSKRHFQSVLLAQAILCVLGSPLGTSLHLSSDPMHSNTRPKQVSFFWRAPQNPFVGNGIPFLLCRGDPPKNDNTKVTLELARSIASCSPCIAGCHAIPPQGPPKLGYRKIMLEACC